MPVAPQPGQCRLQDVLFESCKMTGIDFTKCDPWLLGVSFKNSLLNLSNFVALQLNHTSFHACVLREVIFDEAELAKADFSDCNLKGASFNKNDLREANFMGTVDYAINPLTNKIQKARFGLPHVISLLSYFNIRIG